MHNSYLAFSQPRFPQPQLIILAHIYKYILNPLIYSLLSQRCRLFYLGPTLQICPFFFAYQFKSGALSQSLSTQLILLAFSLVWKKIYKYNFWWVFLKGWKKIYSVYIYTLSPAQILKPLIWKVHKFVCTPFWIQTEINNINDNFVSQKLSEGLI